MSVNTSISIPPKLPIVLPKASLMRVKEKGSLSYRQITYTDASDIFSLVPSKLNTSRVTTQHTDPDIKPAPTSPKHLRKAKNPRNKSPSQSSPSLRLVKGSSCLTVESSPIRNVASNSLNNATIQAYYIAGVNKYSRAKNSSAFPSSYMHSRGTLGNESMTANEVNDTVIEHEEEPQYYKGKSLTTKQRITTRAALKYFCAFGDLDIPQNNKKGTARDLSFSKTRTTEVASALKGRISELMREKEKSLQVMKSARVSLKTGPAIHIERSKPIQIGSLDPPPSQTLYQKTSVRFPSFSKQG